MKPTIEFERRAERFIDAYCNFKNTGRIGDLFPCLYHLVAYCIYRYPSSFVKKS